MIAGTAASAIPVGAKLSPEDLVAFQAAVGKSGGENSFEIQFALDPTIIDGRFGNNAWLQELPKPWTRLTWENAVLMAPADTSRLGLREGDKVEVLVDKRSVTGPVWPTPGIPRGP